MSALVQRLLLMTVDQGCEAPRKEEGKVRAIVLTWEILTQVFICDPTGIDLFANMLVRHQTVMHRFSFHAILH